MVPTESVIFGDIIIVAMNTGWKEKEGAGWEKHKADKREEKWELERRSASPHPKGAISELSAYHS